MNRLLVLLTLALLSLNVTAWSKPSSIDKPANNDLLKSSSASYRVSIPGTGPGGGTFIKSRLAGIQRLSPGKYLPTAIHIKTRNNYTYSKDDKVLYSSVIMSSLKNLGIKSIRAPFAPESGDRMQSAKSTNGIERIFEINYTNGQDPYDVCAELIKNPEIEYATPIFNRYTMDYSPDDPMMDSQWAVSKMELRKAWGLTKGSKDVIIAIVDSGVDWNHPDLKANIWTNTKEVPGNGKDDDGNGKIDDIHGWDLVGSVNTNDLSLGNWKEDNDPSNSPGFHGTHVAGLASASTDNGTGIAGTGFNCSILPVKCGSEQYTIGVFRGYDGIKYAADMGADVINCSWGGEGHSQVEQDIIDYAVSKGAVVVVASGNEGSSIDEGGSYPAAYDNVLCVGSTGTNDNMSGFSNYGITTTVFAPGQSILSTLPDDSYGEESGTSMATPIVSGLAGLVKSLHPDWTPRQIIHQIRSSCDNVVAASEAARRYQYGRVNAFNAVSNNSASGVNVPGIEVTDYSLASGSALTGYQPSPMTVRIENFLGEAPDLTVKFTPLDNFISVSKESVDAGTLGSKANKTLELEVALMPNNPWYKGSARILVTFVSGAYTDYQLINIPVDVPSANSYNKKYQYPESAVLQWHSVTACSQNTIWAVYQSNFNNGGSYIKYSGGTPAYKQVSSDPLYCIWAKDDMTAYAATGTQTSTNASVYKTVDGGGSWTENDVTSITTFVNDIHFYDDNNGVFLGDPKGSLWGVATTSDAGGNWTIVSNMPAPIKGETGLVGSTAWLGDKIWFGTTKGRVFISPDMGKTWTVSEVPGAATIHMLAFKDDKSGLAVYSESSAAGSPMILASTGNGGISWTSDKYNFTNNGLYPVSGFTIENTNKIFIVFSDGRVSATADNGNNWTPVLSADHGNVMEGAAISYKTGKARVWDLGQSIGYLDFDYEVENAKREFKITSATPFDFGTVELSKGKIGNITVKNTGNADINMFNMSTAPDQGTDSSEFKIFGTNEFTIEAGDEISVKVRFSPKQKGVRSGRLIFSTDAPDQTTNSVALTGNGDDPNSVGETNEEAGLTIESVSPNPATTEATISYSLRQAGSVSFSILNVNGSTVSDVYSGQANAGSGTLRFRTDGLASGVYYMQLNSAGGTVVSKFVVQR